MNWRHEMETAKAFWELPDLIGEIVRRVSGGGRTVAEVVDDMWPIRLKPDHQATVLREGIIRLANDRAGMRGFRSGHVQSIRSGPKPVAEESAGLDEFADRLLARLVYHGADGSMRSVLDFTEADARAQYRERVEALRERASREEPFWEAMIGETSKGALRNRPKTARRKLAQMAIAAGLTNDS